MPRPCAAWPGYGVGVLGDRFTGTPNMGFWLADGGGREYRLGWRLARATGGTFRPSGSFGYFGSFGSFTLSLDATRSEPAGDSTGTAPAHAIVLRAGLRW